MFVIGPIALALIIRTLLKRSAARFSSDNAIAETFADDEGAFSLDVPATQPVGIYAEYTIGATKRGGGGISYGLVLRLDVERADFAQRGEYLIGQAQRPFGEVALADSISGGPHVRHGLDLRRAMLLAKVPAGEPLKVSGKVKRTGGETHSLHVYAKPLA